LNIDFGINNERQDFKIVVCNMYCVGGFLWGGGRVEELEELKVREYG
jgi:hypothetical protein